MEKTILVITIVCVGIAVGVIVLSLNEMVVNAQRVRHTCEKTDMVIFIDDINIRNVYKCENIK